MKRSHGLFVEVMLHIIIQKVVFVLYNMAPEHDEMYVFTM